MFPASSNSVLARELPLLVFTPELWAKQVLSNLPVLLSDHAHLEKKAGINALMLLHRRPEQSKIADVGARWCKELVQIGKEEVDHLEIVLKIINARGFELSKNHGNKYASDLRKLERGGSDPEDLVDRLLVSALIEARSCERFYLLGELTDDVELRKLYCGLWSSEHNHYLTFLGLAKFLMPEELVLDRWQEMLKLEAQVIQAQKPDCKMHSWVK